MYRPRDLATRQNCEVIIFNVSYHRPTALTSRFNCMFRRDEHARSQAAQDTKSESSVTPAGNIANSDDPAPTAGHQVRTLYYHSRYIQYAYITAFATLKLLVVFVPRIPKYSKTATCEACTFCVLSAERGVRISTETLCPYATRT